MKRLLLTSLFALVLVIGMPGVTSITHAQGEFGTDEEQTQGGLGTDETSGDHSGDEVAGGENGGGGSGGTGGGGGGTVDPSAAGTASAFGKALDDGYDFLMLKVMSLFAWLVGVAAITLNYAVYYTVVTMGSYINQLSAVGVTWRILRDIGNIMIIFGFLAAGLMMILRTEMYGFGKKMLPMLLIGAIFLNFSLFFAEAVIDGGNLFATQFYKQINGGGTISPPSISLRSTAASDEGISNKIMSQLGVQTIYGNAKNNQQVFKSGTPWYVGFMGILLFLVLAFVLFTLAFILIARFIMLLFLIILSPIGFAGLAIPKLSGVAHKWWAALFEQTITAPILLLLLYIALTVITDGSFLTGFGVGNNSAATSAWTGFVENGNLPAFAGVLLSFLVAMGLLIGVIILSKRLSAFGAGWASQTAGKLSFGVTAWGMRSTVGAGSQYFSQALRRTKFGSTKTGRLITTTLDRGAKGSFDLRGTSALKTAGVDAGSAIKGYRAHRDEVVKEHKEYASSIAHAYDDVGTSAADRAKVEKGKKDATKAVKEATQVHTTAGQLVQQHKKEVVDLEAQKANDRYWNTDEKNEKKLTEAKERFAKSEGSLATASANLEKATKNLKVANEQNADDIAKKRIPIEKKERQEAYARNIDGLPIIGSVPGWMIFGPGGPIAAKKIIKDASKTEHQKFIENLEGALKHTTNPPTPQTTTSGGGGGNTPTPQTSTPPAGGGAGDGHH